MVIERYKLSAHCVHFYIEKWMNFLVFYSQTFFDHISLVFHYFEQFFFIKKGVNIEKTGWGVFGGYSRRRHRRRKKGIPVHFLSYQS